MTDEEMKTRDIKLRFGEIYDFLLGVKMRGEIARPMLLLGDFKFMWSPDGGRNVDHVYVTHKKDYIGKFKNDFPMQFGPIVIHRSLYVLLLSYATLRYHEIPTELELHGKKTGICGCCGRTLTNEESITRGIGPICIGRYGL